MAESEPFAPSGEEQGFLAAIKAAPDDLTAHHVYADWLDEHMQPSRAAVLRAWVAFARVPVCESGMDPVYDAHQAYQRTLFQKDADWIEAMEKVRRWIPKPLAEKVVRICIKDVYGAEYAASWAVDVSPCIFDNRWHGGYKGTTKKDGQTVNRSGAFYVVQITGAPDGHVCSI